jgi:hypothetical protein
MQTKPHPQISSFRAQGDFKLMANIDTLLTTVSCKFSHNNSMILSGLWKTSNSNIGVTNSLEKEKTNL